MYLIDTTRKLPLARILALVALLCTGALQAQEAGHGHLHELDDSYAQCLVYKHSGAAALAVVPALPPVPARDARVSEPAASPLRASQSSPFLARGPPAHS